jgi:hypothetical protein
VIRAFAALILILLLTGQLLPLLAP